MEYELLLLNLQREAKFQPLHFRESIGQHSIAAYISQFGFSAKVYSGDILDAQKVILRETQIYHVPVIGFYVGADNVVSIGNLIKWLKTNIKSTIFVGGPEAWALGESFLRDTNCDYIMVGEGEIPTRQLLSYLIDQQGTLDQVQSLRFLDADGVYRCTPLAPLIQNLDSIPFPRREDSLHQRYHMGHTMGLLTGRGCPNHCTFCFEGASSKTVRLRSIENVMQEIDTVKSYNPSLSHVNIFDDTFTLNPHRVSEFCREIKKRNLTWTCEAHVRILYQNLSMISEMVDAGLVAMQLGIESGSQLVLDAYQKKCSPEMMIDIIRECKKSGLRCVEGNYIIGGAFEDKETIEQSLKHAKLLIEEGRGMLELHTVYFAPYYGTPITMNPENFGMQLVEQRAEHIVTTMRDAVVRTQKLSADEIVKLRLNFSKELDEFYLQQAALCNKDDILRIFGTSQEKESQIYNQRWSVACSYIPHLYTFVRHLSEEEQSYSDQKYPIRTGFDYYMLDDKIEVDDILLSGPEAQAWIYADGKYTVAQLAQKLALPLETVRELYKKLNHLCLLYFSTF